MIKIVFGKSSSHNYNLAIKHALKNASNYYETNSDDVTINVAEYELDNIVNAEKLWDMVRKWKSAEIFRVKMVIY